MRLTQNPTITSHAISAWIQRVVFLLYSKSIKVIVLTIYFPLLHIVHSTPLIFSYQILDNKLHISTKPLNFRLYPCSTLFLAVCNMPLFSADIILLFFSICAFFNAFSSGSICLLFNFRVETFIYGIRKMWPTNREQKLKPHLQGGNINASGQRNQEICKNVHKAPYSYTHTHIQSAKRKLSNLCDHFVILTKDQPQAIYEYIHTCINVLILRE